jgi:diguanylate cyclase (GGDEF)-like protein
VNTIAGSLDVCARRSLDRIARAAAALLDAPLVLISVFEGPRQIYVGSHGLARMRASEPSPLCREVASAGMPIVMQDARRRLPAAARGVWGFELVAYAGVPLNLLVPSPSRVGTLAVLAPARRAWQSHDLHVLRCLADAAAAILDMQAGCEAIVDEERRGAAQRIESASAKGKRRTLELEKTSIHDELTGLLNRRGLFAIAPAQLDAIHRHCIGGLLLYVDLDGLKVTNDRHGHSAGDDLLRSAASVLRASFRDTDTVARLGGDEFVVIAGDAPREEHPVFLARLATELGRANKRRDPTIPLAWSLGLVSIEPATKVSLDSLMSAADGRMYTAKRTLHDLVVARRLPVA